MRVRSLVLTALAALAATSLPAQQATVQERLDLSALARIREEGLNRSRVDSLAGHLTDVIGPRLTASTGMRRAQRWAEQTLRGWGLANVALEPWDTVFGRGWDLVSFSARVLEPYTDPLTALPQAWSGNTRGTVSCPVMIAEITDTTTYAQHAGRLRGASIES